MSNDDTTYECEKCGHAYTARYGSVIEAKAKDWQWWCFDCQQKRKRA